MLVDVSVRISQNFNILLAECTSGTYGVNCENRCDTCVNKLCDREDGQCTYGCINRFKGESCQLQGIPTLDCIISC
jgi:hypothetical protein